MKTNKIISTILFCYFFLPVFCQTSQQKDFTIKGHISGIKNGAKVYL